MSNVPKLRFKEFSGEWEEKKLNDVGFITTGSTPSTSISEYYNGDRLFVSPVDIQGNRYINKTKTTLTELGFSKGRKVVRDSVCFVCIGSTIGKVAQLTEDSLTNQQINCITANNKNFNNFIYSLLELKAPKIKLLAGEQALPQINKSDFSKLKFFLPSKQEQEKIASFLTSIDTKIEQLTKKEELLQQYKKGVMQKIFNQEIRFKADDGSKFEDWEEKTIGDIGKVSMCKRILKDQTTADGDIPFYKIGTFGKEPDAYISNEVYNDFRSKYSFPKVGDILLSASGTIGRTVVYDGKPAYFQDSNIVWIDNHEELVLNSFLYYCYKIIKWTTEDTTIARLYNNNLRSMKINIPKSLEEQTKIANFLSSIDSKIEQVLAQLASTKVFKKALLHQMFV